MSELLAKVSNALDQVVFTFQGDGCFRLHSGIPEWLIYYTHRDVVDSAYDLSNSFPFLSHFLDDAKDHWEKNDSSILTSDIWIEVDSIGREVAFETDVMIVDKQQVLVLKRLSVKFKEQKAMLQHIREGLLTKEDLEAELLVRTKEIRLREEEISLKLIS